MRKNVRFGWGVFCVLFVLQGCRAQAPDWNGTWILNTTKSSYQGEILTISISADGGYTFDERSPHSIRCDGNEEQTEGDQTRDCVRRGPKVLEITVKKNGVRARVTRDELSADGKTFTTTAVAYGSNGPSAPSEAHFSRLSGASDNFAGQWRDLRYLREAEMILKLDNHILYIGYPSADQYVDAPLNGGDAAVRGTGALEGTTLAVRPGENRDFQIVTKRDGKIFSQGSLEISGDGRVVTRSWWNPDQAAKIGTLVYEKK